VPRRNPRRWGGLRGRRFDLRQPSDPEQELVSQVDIAKSQSLELLSRERQKYRAIDLLLKQHLTNPAEHS